MTNVADFPGAARKLTEYEAIVSAAPSALDAIPGAVYVCDRAGRLVRYNAEAVALWGRVPTLSDGSELYCGSQRLFLPDGTRLAHADCPMAETLKSGTATRNAEVVIERPDGRRVTALVNIRALRDHAGEIEGAINCFQDVSAHKQMEHEVRSKTRDLEDFFENSAIGLHIVSGEGLILRANRAELDMLGYSAEEYVGRHIAEFHVDAPVIGEILKRLSSGDTLDRFPARLRARDGSIRHVLITSNSRFSEGKFINTRCFTTDVTDLHQAESGRRESEERLAATYEAATVAIAETDRDGRLLRVNDALCKMLGRSRDQLLGMTVFEYTHEEDRAEDLASYARQVSGELASYAIRKRAARPDGTEVVLDVFSSSVRDASGGFRYGVRVVQDVTEAKRMEDRLRASERQMRELLEALPAAIYTTDAEGRITFYNRAAVEMAGRVPRTGDAWCVTWRLYKPDGAPLPHDQCPMAVALREDRPVRGAEAIAERPDGTRIPFIPYPTPLHDSEGRLVGAINMLVDITERKKAENRQKVLIDELNHRVKNTLATVQSLAIQTARHAPEPGEFVRGFQARLLALSRAHDLLTERHWGDASLGSLTREVLGPVVGARADQLRIDGPEVRLSPRAALSLVMALNELATNAIKYGALTVDAGLLHVSWNLRRDDDRTRLDLAWQERGGPPVTLPLRRGFGTRLIERCIERDLGGEVDIAFEPEGVSCRIAIPVDAQ